MMTQQLSSKIRSSQQGIHSRLEARVKRHLGHAWRQPVHEPTAKAFSIVRRWIQDDPRPLVLDSGCGTGESSRNLAERHPGAWIVAIDQSRSRLSKASRGELPMIDGNVIWVRAELAAFWSLAFNAGWTLKAHYLLYPNPWPKPSQLQRRWHGHPVFPTMMKLGGAIELRTNWEIYAGEFAMAVQLVTGFEAQVMALQPDTISSAFERKYSASEHDLWQVRVPNLAGYAS